MHDLDRVSMQREGEFEGQAFEFEGEGEGEAPRYGGAPPLREGEVTELAAELLSVSNEQELEQFLGDLVDRAAHAVRGAINSPTGHAVIEALKPVAKAAIPAAASALGGAVGGAISDGAGAPIGAAIGGAAGDAAVRALGLELEGLSMEDRELEVAKQVVRLAATATSNAAAAPPGEPPHAVANAAVREAARHLAPGLLRGLGAPENGRGHDSYGFGRSPEGGIAQSGRWFRRGNKIVIVGA
jgi:hypothetical protein